MFQASPAPLSLLVRGGSPAESRTRYLARSFDTRLGISIPILPVSEPSVPSPLPPPSLVSLSPLIHVSSAVAW